MNTDVLEDVGIHTAIDLIKKAGIPPEYQQKLQYYASGLPEYISSNNTQMLDELHAPIVVDFVTFTAIEQGNSFVINWLLKNPLTRDYISTKDAFITHALCLGTLDIVNSLLAIPTLLNSVKQKPSVSIISSICSDKPEIVERILEIESVLQYVKEYSLDVLKTVEMRQHICLNAIMGAIKKQQFTEIAELVD